ncbi:hypothetical protein [Anaerococcus sp. Marseille-Q7828]|uniref:hypothetical protein n=1 Tax=Anaerococcus sp. Marseille-Q7828 TaxID=3036300 RepID=UPI0024AE5DF1|nr:hypothetical protein [Anaerococcus sp. Marseille-Q7828]
MNNTSKTILATLALSLALVGCDNVVKNDKEGEAPVVEENTENAPAENAEETTDQAAEDQAGENTDENSEENSAEGTEENADENADENAEETKDDMADASDKDIRETLEQAIFDNRTQARAIEILLEMTPEQVADIKPELEQMLEDSNQLIDEAQATLDQLGN